MKTTRKEWGRWIIAIVVLVLVGSTSSARALVAETTGSNSGKVTTDQGGQIYGLRLNPEQGPAIEAPLLSQDISVSISGLVAGVKVVQRFQNIASDWVEAVYTFPLPDESGVDGYRMIIGERVVEGVVREKQQAEAMHLAAKQEGRKSALLSQHRANIFSTRLANIAPGEEVAVEIEFAQTVAVSGDEFTFRLPMVVGPRYIPGTPLQTSREQVSFSSGGWGLATDRVADAPDITPPVDVHGQRPIEVKLAIDLAAGFALQKVESLSHQMQSRQLSEGHYLLNLVEPVRANRDFVLRWQPQTAADARAALFSESLEGQQYSLLMLLPPQEQAMAEARELVLVLDVSGSMAGESIHQAKQAVMDALDHLGQGDYFNLIIFNDEAETLFPRSQPAESNNLAAARRLVTSLRADGGTEMAKALNLALDGSTSHQRLRQVVFLTDGAVGNEAELFAMITRRLGDSRLFTVGIGSAPNSYFMTRAAELGRGTFTYVGKVEEVAERMSRLLTQLSSPVVTDLRLVLPEGDHDLEVYPSPLPDLYLGEPLLVLLRTGWENETLSFEGRTGGKEWQVTVDTRAYGQRLGIARLWARKKIRSLMQSLSLGEGEQQVREEVLATALKHQLVSRYTSMVAVDSQPARPLQEGVKTSPVATELPHGWQAQAIFGGVPQTATPGPLLVLAGALSLLLCATLIWVQRWFRVGRCAR